MKGIYLMYLVVPLLVLICWQQSSALTPKEQLVQIKQDMKKKREALVQVRSREDNTSKRIQACQRRAQEQSKRITETEKRISNLHLGIRMKQRDLAVEKSARLNRQQMWQSRLSGYSGPCRPRFRRDADRQSDLMATGIPVGSRPLFRCKPTGCL